MTPYPIIGMSPGNSYFKDEQVDYLLHTTIDRYGKAAILIADIPAIATYMAYGYSENEARNKAIPKGNNLKNRSKRIVENLGISDKVHIIDWANEVENNPDYQAAYGKIKDLYNTSPDFKKAVDETTAIVLEGSDYDIPNMEQSIQIANHYLLAELAFLDYSPTFFEYIPGGLYLSS